MQAESAGIFAYWPNRVTGMRFVGSLVLFVLLTLWAQDGEVGAARFAVPCFWLFIVTACTDFVDGYLARRDNQVTAFGRIADPFVDKVLVLGTFVYLTSMDWSRVYVPSWMVVVVLAREFLVTGVRGYVESIGKEFPADWFGKIKMIVQCVAIGAVLGIHALPWWPESLRGLIVPIAHGSMWATLLTSVGSGVSYVMKTKRILSEA